MNSGGEKPTKLIITGISGLVGSHLAHRTDGRFEITGLSRQPEKYPLNKNITPVQLDVTDEVAFDAFLEKCRFDVFINCAAIADVDLCETERQLAQKVNAEIPKYIAGYCKKQNCLLIHLSTDYLFDGRGGPYAEEATPDPINFYGETKLRGEESIVNSGCEYIIVRTNQIYGNLPDGPSRLIRWVLKGKNERIRAAQDQYNNSTWAGNLADCIIELLKGAFRGVINIGGPDYLSRYDFAVKGAGVFGFENGNIIKGLMGDLELAASRPLKAGLTIAKMREILRTAPVSVLDGLKKVRDGAF